MSTKIKSSNLDSDLEINGTLTANTFVGAVSGNADTAAALETARTLTIGNTGKSFDGSSDVSWSLGDIGVNDSTLTLSTSGIASGSQTWTSNQGSNATFTVDVPGTNLAMGGSGNSRTITSSTGNNVSVPVANTSNAGFMSTGDKTKLDGIETGAQVNVGTNLGSSGTGGTRTITSSTGSNTSITYTAADVGAVPTSRTLTAGDGLSGGGNLTANRSFAVDSTVVRTSGDQTIGGIKTFTDRTVFDTDVGSGITIGGGPGDYTTYNLVSRSNQATWYFDRDIIDFLEIRRHNSGGGFFSPFVFDFNDDSLSVNGKIGIGTTSPSERLHVNGRIVSDSIGDTTARDYPGDNINNHNTNDFCSRFFNPTNGPSGNGHSTLTFARSATNFAQINMRTDNSALRYSTLMQIRQISSSGGVGPWAIVYHTQNTTVDGNGFIKEASPIVRLYDDHIEEPIEAVNATMEKLGVGHYVLHNVPCLATEGWQIETPQDHNGNRFVFVEVEYTEETCDLAVYTSRRVWDAEKGLWVAGDPVNIPESRWVDLRFWKDNSEN